MQFKFASDTMLEEAVNMLSRIRVQCDHCKLKVVKTQNKLVIYLEQCIVPLLNIGLCIAISSCDGLGVTDPPHTLEISQMALEIE